MKKYQVGIIGTGFIGKQHIEAIGRIPGVYIKAISDMNEEQGRKVGEQFGIKEFYQDYKELLKDPEIDVIHNCTPTFMHYPISRDAILSGKHVYCEKPLTLTAAEAEELVDLAEKKSVSGAVNFNYRSNVMVHEMKARIEKGKIGTPFMIYGEYLQDWLLYDTDYDWRMNPEMGGISRAVADIGSHCFDTMEYVLGRKIISVYARLINVYPVRKKGMNSGETFAHRNSGDYLEVSVPSEDAAFIMVEFEKGIHGFINLSQVCAGMKNGMSICVSGSEGSLKWKQERADHLWAGHRDSGNEDIYAASQFLEKESRAFASLPAGHSVGWADAFCNGIRNFYDCLDKKKCNYGYADLRDGLRVMKIIKACVISNKENRWVDVC